MFKIIFQLLDIRFKTRLLLPLFLHNIFRCALYKLSVAQLSVNALYKLLQTGNFFFQTLAFSRNQCTCCASYCQQRLRFLRQMFKIIFQLLNIRFEACLLLPLFFYHLFWCALYKLRVA